MRKVVKEYHYNALGFPVVLHNIPMVNIRGVWCLDLNMNEFMRTVMIKLQANKSKLTEDQLHFLDSYKALVKRRYGT